LVGVIHIPSVASANESPTPDRPRVLVIRGGAIGDFILTLPAIRLLLEGLPNPHIEILGYPGITSVAILGGLAEGARSIEHASLAPFFCPGANLDPTLAAYLASFPLVVSYLHDQDGHFGANLERAGVRNLIRGSHRMDESGEIPAAVQLAKPLDELALYLEQPWISLGLQRPTPPSSVVAIHPGSGSPRKNWGYERWAEFASRLGAASYLVVSGEAERDTIQDLLSDLDRRDIRFEHLACAPLPTVAQALTTCCGFVGHDSGISHLAAACDLPCFVLFGQTKPEIWAPQNPGVTVIRAPGGQLASLSPAAVADAVGTGLAQGTEPA
jgi:ADP-heptose:LPS heptosyltransferase